MKINFTKNEYHLLVEMLTVADWVMHEGREPDEIKFQKHRALRNKIFSFYKDFDAKSILDAGLEKNEFYETDELLGKVHDNYMVPYKEEILLDELSYRLAQRDVYYEIGDEIYEEADRMELVSKIFSAQESYLEEFAKHGLENVIIKLSTEK